MICDLTQGRERSEAQAVLGYRDAAQAVDIANVDELRRRDDAILHQVEQIDAPSLDGGAVAELPKSLIYCFAINVCELIHACTSPCTLPSAVSTFAGVIGILRMRTPVAL